MSGEGAGSAQHSVTQVQGWCSSCSAPRGCGHAASRTSSTAGLRLSQAGLREPRCRRSHDYIPWPVQVPKHDSSSSRSGCQGKGKPSQKGPEMKCKGENALSGVTTAIQSAYAAGQDVNQERKGSAVRAEWRVGESLTPNETGNEQSLWQARTETGRATWVLQK